MRRSRIDLLQQIRWPWRNGDLYLDAMLGCESEMETFQLIVVAEVKWMV